MNKSSKRKSRRSLILLLLLVTGTMLGTSTYAWFTSNKTVGVTDITVNVAAKNGIQISVDGTNWKSIISTTDLLAAKTTYSAAVNQIPNESNSIQPVSTVGTILDGGFMEMFVGDVPSNDDGEYILTALKSTETNGTSGDFIAFDLFLKSDKAVNLDMTGTSGVRASENAGDTGIKNASRVAFLVQGNTSSDASVSDIQGMKLLAGSTEGVYIWEPNYNVHNGTGIANARDTYNLTITENEAERVKYDGVKAEISADDNILLGQANSTEKPEKFDEVEIDYLTRDTFTGEDTISIFSLQAGITKVRVYMWVEGQDVDCENNASGGNIDYNLQFTIHEEA